MTPAGGLVSRSGCKEIDDMATWRVRSRQGSFQWEGELVAYWEANYDPISDDYTPEDISASDLLRMWAKRVREYHPDGMISISWSVQCHKAKQYEYMPFQYIPGPNTGTHADFLTYYHWPVHSKTGARLNWHTLPVVDKLRNKRQCDKGGFIQEATGWKPSILQPFVSLPALLQASGLEDVSI